MLIKQEGRSKEGKGVKFGHVKYLEVWWGGGILMLLSSLQKVPVSEWNCSGS
jgi:hypothetical protein